MALGIGGSASGLANILNALLTSYFADAFGVAFSLGFAAALCAASVVSALVLIPIDQSARSVSDTVLPNGQPTVATPAQPVKITDVTHFGYVHCLSCEVA